MPVSYPAAPFNKYPVGLLGLLDAKVQGKTPNELAQVTLPTLELARFLLEQGSEVLNDATANVGAVGRHFGAAATLTVPTSELWFIHAATVRPNAVLAAGTTYVFRILHETTLAVGPSAIGAFYKGNQGNGSTGGQPVSSCGLEEAFLMQPGDRIGAYVESGAFGTAIPFQLFAKLSRLPI